MESAVRCTELTRIFEATGGLQERACDTQCVLTCLRSGRPVVLFWRRVDDSESCNFHKLYAACALPLCAASLYHAAADRLSGKKLRSSPRKELSRTERGGGPAGLCALSTLANGSNTSFGFAINICDEVLQSPFSKRMPSAFSAYPALDPAEEEHAAEA